MKDNVTGLIWEDKASWSRTEKAASAAPTVTCGSTLNWRLPTVKELISIVSYHSATSAVGNTAEFFRLPSSSLGGFDFWTATTSQYPTGLCWSVSFNNGSSDYTRDCATGTLYSRFVKGESSSSGLTKGTGVVIDKNTKLVWKKCLEGYSSGDSCAADGTKTTFTWSEALARAADNTNDGWRLPNIKELQSIVDEGKSNPAINTDFFPGNIVSSVWSSSPNAAATTTSSWRIIFKHENANYGGYGEVLSENHTALMHVRLVRDCTAADTACYN